MGLFVTIVKDIHALTNVTKISILDVAESLDLLNGKKRTCIMKIPAKFTVRLFKYVTPFVTTTRPTFTCPKSTIKTLEQGGKCFQG